jgi:hypothetical protein
MPGGGNAVRRLDLESQFQARVCVYFGDLAWKSAAYWLHECALLLQRSIELHAGDFATRLASL